MNKNTCPCGRNQTYEMCCKRIHTDMHTAQTAEDLMRSRYAAFTLGKGDYLMDSQHSSTRNVSEKNSVVAWAKSVQWMNLDVLETTQGGKDDASGTVAFKAFFIEAGKLNVIEENSVFERENGHWVYVGPVN